MEDVRFKIENTSDQDELKSKLAKHGLDLDFDNEDIMDGIFYNSDLRSYCGFMIDHDDIVMFPKYIPEYMDKLKNDPDFKILVVNKK